MNTITDAYQAMAEAIVADPTLSRGDAGDVIEAFGPTMPGVAARQFIDAVATEYEALGTINNPTYSSLRGEIVNEGAVKSVALFMALAAQINGTPEAAVVNAAILLESNAQAKASIPANIAIIEGHKTGGANQQLDDALDVAISALNQLDQSIP